MGTATQSGPVVVNFIPPTSGASSGCASVSHELAKAIQQHPENYYVNAHTGEFPAGAIRGQIGK